MRRSTNSHYLTVRTSMPTPTSKQVRLVLMRRQCALRCCGRVVRCRRAWRIDCDEGLASRDHESRPRSPYRRRLLHAPDARKWRSRTPDPNPTGFRLGSDRHAERRTLEPGFVRAFRSASPAASLIYSSRVGSPVRSSRHCTGSAVSTSCIQPRLPFPINTKEALTRHEARHYV